MKVKRGTDKFKNPAGFVSYLFRKEETGLLFTTDIMRDQKFREDVTGLLNAQKHSFYAGKIRMNADLMDRRQEILDLTDKAFHTVGSRDIQNLSHLVRDLDATAKFQKDGDHFANIIEPIPIPATGDVKEIEANIIRAGEAVINMFPKNLPVVMTIHTKGGERLCNLEDAIKHRRAIHFQFLTMTKIWDGLDSDPSKVWKSGWGKPCDMIAPKKGDEYKLGETGDRMRAIVEGIMSAEFQRHTQLKVDAAGNRHRVAVDACRPVRTHFSEEAAKIIGCRTHEQLMQLPHESISNLYVREEIRQVREQAAYDIALNTPVRPVDPIRQAALDVPSLQLNMIEPTQKKMTFTDVLRQYERDVTFLHAVNQHVIPATDQNEPEAAINSEVILVPESIAPTEQSLVVPGPKPISPYIGQKPKLHI